MISSINLALTVPAEINPNGVQVRTQGSQEKPLFCLADVCKVLGNANPSRVADRLAEDEKGIHIVNTPGGSQEMLLVNEDLLAGRGVLFEGRPRGPRI